MAFRSPVSGPYGPNAVAMLPVLTLNEWGCPYLYLLHSPNTAGTKPNRTVASENLVVGASFVEFAFAVLTETKK